jgi:hypothetical protein
MKTYRTVRPLLVQAVQAEEPIEIRTSTGVLRANKGDWLVLGPHGEYYPCSDADFKSTFETINTPFEFADKQGRECGC